MGLDLTALSQQIREMSQGAAGHVADDLARTTLLRRQYTAEVGAEAHWATAVSLSRERANWLLARPVEPLDTVRDMQTCPSTYALVATDGSHIDLDRHGSVACAVINLGLVYLRYGDQPTAELRSHPQLYYREDDLFLRDGTRRFAIEGNYLSARRDVEEGVALAQLAEAYLDESVPAIALQDGTLVRWALAGADRFVQDYFLDRYLDYLERMRQRGIAVASYISRPRSPEVVGTIRLMLCPDVDVPNQRGANCAVCSDQRAGREPSCMPAQGLVDSDILGAMLAEGQRGPIFVSMSRINLERYGPHLIHFFYLRVQRELCRIEIPAWVACNPVLVDRIHTLVYDQCDRGQGYPVALARAHEQAVIRGADRRAFAQLVEGSLARADATAHSSAKQTSKSFSRG